MKSLVLNLTLTVLFLALVSNSEAQNSSVAKVKTVQPKIMVIPYALEGEDIRTIIQKNFYVSTVLGTIKKAFDLRGFTTVDFEGKLKSSLESGAYRSKDKNDFKNELLKGSGADICVEARIQYLESSASGNAINISIQATEIMTGNSLANEPLCESQRFFTDNIAKLAEVAINSKIEPFLNMMQLKFTETTKDGRSVNVNIGIDVNSKYTFSSVIKGLPLSDLTEKWFQDNAYQNNYHIGSSSKNEMILDDVKIPLKDEKTGRNYNESQFSLSIWLFFQELGLTVEKESKNGKIFITIK